MNHTTHRHYTCSCHGRGAQTQQYCYRCIVLNGLSDKIRAVLSNAVQSKRYFDIDRYCHVCARHCERYESNKLCLRCACTICTNCYSVRSSAGFCVDCILHLGVTHSFKMNGVFVDEQRNFVPPPCYTTNDDLEPEWMNFDIQDNYKTNEFLFQ